MSSRPNDDAAAPAERERLTDFTELLTHMVSGTATADDVARLEARAAERNGELEQLLTTPATDAADAPSDPAS